MPTILKQLQSAYDRTGWTMVELARQLAKHGVLRDRSSLRRQMLGKTQMRTDMAEALARTLSVTLAIVPDPKDAS